MIELRDYQQDCVRLVLDAYERHRTAPCKENRMELVVLPTGAGKTICFGSIIHELNRRHGINALIIAHRDELLDQAAEKYRMIRPDAIIGKVGSGIHQYGGEVTVASIATISRPEHLKKLRAIGYGIIIIDEAHHQAAAGYQRVLDALPDTFVLSVTATPKRLDGKPIIEKSPLYQRTILEMIKDGYLCDIRAIAIKTETSLDDVRSLAGDFNEHDLDLAVNTPARNKRVVQAYLEHASGKRALCFGVTVAHAEALAYAFNDMGVSAGLIEGNTPLDERRALYQAFRTGHIRVLCNVMVLTEGFDEPLAEVAILARPTQSQSLYIQQVGRVLRPAPGKRQAIILDLTDNCLKHRLAPQNFKRAIHADVKDEETLLESLAREENEKAEREATEKRALICKLNSRRTQDREISIFGLPDWQELPDGKFVMEVGLEKHRIALVPCGGIGSGMYEVWARLAPGFDAQKWAGAQPLDWALQLAEKRAHLLLEQPHARVLVDQNAAWRSQPVTEGQMKMLRWYRIPVQEGMTKGEAADLIDAHKRQLEQKKAAKEARQQAVAAGAENAVQDDNPPGHLNTGQVFHLMR